MRKMLYSFQKQLQFHKMKIGDLNIIKFLLFLTANADRPAVSFTLAE